MKIMTHRIIYSYCLTTGFIGTAVWKETPGTQVLETVGVFTPAELGKLFWDGSN